MIEASYMAEPVVVVSDLWRTYKTSVGVLRRRKHLIEALKGISLEVQHAELFGLVGPNGAGKTTLIKILTTMLLPTRGMATVLGLDVSRQERLLRPKINFILGGERGLYWRLSGQDNLSYFADLYRVDRQTSHRRIEELLKLVGLWERRDGRVEGYSKGMKQRLHVAKALINDPKVLFLDEPTIGLDPVAARNLRRLIADMRSRGTTVFLTSHYMWEMEALCDRIAVLKDGRIIALDTPSNLKSHVGGIDVVELQLLDDLDGLDDHLRTLRYVDTVSVSTTGHVQTMRVQTSNSRATMDEIRGSHPHMDLSRIVVRSPNLEDAYVKLIEDEE